MKKFASFLLVLTLLLALLTVPAMAEEGVVTVVVSTDKTELKPGEDVTVTYRVDNPSQLPIAGLSFNVVVPEGFEYVSHDDRLNGAKMYFDNTGFNYKENLYQCTGYSDMDHPEGLTNASWTVVSIVYKATEAISLGEKTFSLNISLLYSGVREGTQFHPHPSAVSPANVKVYHTEHTWSEWQTTDPTCKDPGVKQRSCTTPGCDAVEKQDLPATGQHTWGPWQDVADDKATCTEPGTQERFCTVCQTRETQTVEALGHDYKISTTDATCTEPGTTTYTCSRCADTYTETGKPLGHDWDDGQVTTEPECETEGVKTFKCRRCQETKTETVPALGHDWDDGEMITEPDCVNDGSKTVKCRRCQETQTVTVPALGHKWDEGKVTLEPTTTKPGEKTYTCTVCGETKTEVLPATVTPQTGDEANLALWLGLMAVCAAGSAAVLVAARKKSRG